MSYVVLARRFRPQGFDDIIGQGHVSQTLKNAILENRVAHAYLLSGPRGVGKTTTARILAKALNCEKGPTAKPCNKCANCMEITNGSSMDVQEIDGASNRGIDEIRALRENVKFAPASSKYKVYIIDEAHQITDAAFNALLKTLEEPPAHVVFILATTEPQKIPITILSRCQRYRFRLLSSKEIMSTLESIAKTEKFDIEHDALQIVTESANGSLRDSLSLLDQVISFASGKIKAEDVQNLLGFLPKEIIRNSVVALKGQDLAAILSIIKEITEQGYSLVQFGRDLRDHLRRLMLYKVNPSILELTEGETKALEEQKSFFSSAWLIRSGQILSKLLDEMRWNTQPRLMLELYLMRLAQPYVSADELVERLEKLENNIPFESADIQAPPVSYPKQSAAAVTAVDSGSDDLSLIWRTVITDFKRNKPMVGNLLSDIVVLPSTGNKMVLGVRNEMQQEGIKRNQEAIEKLINDRFGKQLHIETMINANLPAVSALEKEDVLIREENSLEQSKEVYRVDDDLSQSKGSIPSDMEKILTKFPGKVTKNK